MQSPRLAREHGMLGKKVYFETYGASVGMVKDDIGEANGMDYERSYISGKRFLYLILRTIRNHKVFFVFCFKCECSCFFFFLLFCIFSCFYNGHVSLFIITALINFNLHTITFTNLKCTIQ